MKLFNIIIFLCFLPILVTAQEWQFDSDSLADKQRTSPMLLNPLIKGYTPEIDFSADQQQNEAGKVYNGFQVQVIAVDNLVKAETVRDTLTMQIDDRVEVVFDAPNYKVRAGAFTDRYDAEKLRQKIYRLGYRSAWIVRARLMH